MALAGLGAIRFFKLGAVMGIDVEIYCELSAGTTEPTDLVLPEGFSLQEAGEYERRFGMTHEVWSGARYYGPYYERGPWPYICAVLMSLFASTNVKRVWCFGDSTGLPVEPITIDDVLEISRHYMTHGERPYRDPAYKAAMKS